MVCWEALCQLVHEPLLHYQDDDLVLCIRDDCSSADLLNPLTIGAVATSFFFGPVYPTVYAHGLDQIEEKQHTETGGALMVMSLVGGAALPVIMGRVSDLTGSMQFSFIVPAIGFALILWFFISEHKIAKKEAQKA